MDIIKVLPIIEVRLIANLVVDVLSAEPDIEVVGFVTNADSALEIMEEQAVDVALVSIGLPAQGALELIRTVGEVSPGTKVLALGLSENPEDVLKYIEAGAVGYVLKDSSLNELTDVVRSTQRGEARVSAKMAGAMIDRLSSIARLFSPVEHGITDHARLTAREQQVLECIGNGCTNQEIAALLLVEIGTVKNHVHNILDKLNVRTREEAATHLAFIKS